MKIKYLGASLGTSSMSSSNVMISSPRFYFGQCVSNVSKSVLQKNNAHICEYITNFFQKHPICPFFQNENPLECTCPLKRTKKINQTRKSNGGGESYGKVCVFITEKPYSG